MLDYHRERLRQEIGAECEIPPREPAEVLAGLLTFKQWLRGHRGGSQIRQSPADDETAIGGRPMSWDGGKPPCGPLSGPDGPEEADRA